MGTPFEMWFSCFLTVWALSFAFHGKPAFGSEIKENPCEDKTTINKYFWGEGLLAAMQYSCNYWYSGWYKINMDLKYSLELECLLSTDYANRKHNYIKTWDVFEVRVDAIKKKKPGDRDFIDRAVRERYRLCYSASMRKPNRVFACTTFKKKGTGMYHEEYTPMYGCAFYSSEELRKLFRAEKSSK